MDIRKIISLAVAMFSLASTFAQNGRYASLDDFPKVKNSTLLVVLYEEDDLYNTNIKEIIEENWKFSPYQFVDTAELYEISKNKGDQEYSMLVRNHSYRLVRRVNGNDKIQSNHLAIYLMDTGSDMRNYTGKDALTQFQLKNVRNTLDYFHKLPAFIKYMQSYLQFIDEKKPTEDTHGKLLREFNSANTQKLSSYTLYLEDQDMEGQIELEEIKAVYPHAVEIVESARILGAVKGAEENAAFMHLDPRVKQISIMDASTGEILYLARTEETGSLQKTDFRKMGKAASGEVSKKGGKFRDKLKNFKKKSN